MKFFRRFVKLAVIIVGIAMVAILVILGIDVLKTNYLKIGHNQLGANDSFLIKNVNIVPMYHDTVLYNKTVYIKEGVIKDINDKIDIEGIETIDAQNKFMTPGLIDMHVHVWDKYELGLYLSHGVTTIRNVWGMPMHLRLKKEINNGTLLAPIFLTTGPKLTGPEFIGDDNLQLKSPEEARNKVISYKKSGYDFIKTYYGLPEDIFNAIIEQARISEMDIVAHPSQKVPYSFHYNPQIVTIEHAEDIVQQPLQYKLDSVKLNQVIEEFSTSQHTSFCPTLIVYYNIFNMLQNDDILSNSLVDYINPAIKMLDSKSQFERWNTIKKEDASIVERIGEQHEFHLYIIKKMNDAGINLVCGTDAGIGITAPGFSVYQELELYKKAGLSNFEILQTATVNASKTHQIMNNLGTIENGKMANLIILEKNPLKDLSTMKEPEMVFIKGRRLNKTTLEEFKNKAYNRKNLIPTILRYVENMVREK
ncbi:amidohydrolase [Arenibacter aquaticus]|uniref:Amidohydrolase n=1 Tax=Arenibacter aquaticus TaxID=2489054 RepID=A0A430JZL5_9FLAO|nr:amidohydrolase family protein [Arenibacter aquaticus]RTE52310.1 amidohydrolase [Arenibacter aquaticus]